VGAFSFEHYISDRWNAFDFTVVTVSLFDIGVQLGIAGSESTANPTLLRAVRIVRVTRVLVRRVTCASCV
jgi:hypothetical protein